MTTYLMRHAPTTYSASYRVNGDPTVHVPLTLEGEAACIRAQSSLPGEITNCVHSAFTRCHRTANLITNGHIPTKADDRLNELAYGDFEGGGFLVYAHWLAEHGPHVPPPGTGESQVGGVARMLRGLRAALCESGSRLVIAHGLLVSVIQWARAHPGESLTDVFLPAATCLTPLVIDDDELQTLTQWLLEDLDGAARLRRPWRADLGVFPREARAVLATVSARA